MASSTFSITRRVEFHETDAAGIMHFSNFYKWMEICEHEWFRTEGITMMSTSAEGIRRGWPRRKLHVILLDLCSLVTLCV